MDRDKHAASCPHAPEAFFIKQECFQASPSSGRVFVFLSDSGLPDVSRGALSFITLKKSVHVKGPASSVSAQAAQPQRCLHRRALQPQ